MKNVVVLCGGRGATSVIRALLDDPDVGQVTALVNGYDDGQSTGLMRRTFPLMLGPSDFRKICTTFGNRPDFEARYTLSEAEAVAAHVNSTPSQDGDTLQTVCAMIRNQSDKEGNPDPLMVVGNLVFTVMHASRTLVDTVATFHDYLKVPQKLHVLPVSSEPAALAARTLSGGVLTSEAAIVSSRFPIKEVFLFPFVKPDHQAVAAVEAADVIIFAPGTFHSSLAPSVLVLRDVLGHAKAPILWIGNLTADEGLQGLTWLECLDQLSLLPSYALLDPSSKLISDVQVTAQDVKTPWGPKQIMPVVMEMSKEDATHDGPVVVDILRKIVKVL